MNAVNCNYSFMTLVHKRLVILAPCKNVVAMLIYSCIVLYFWIYHEDVPCEQGKYHANVANLLLQIVINDNG